MPSACWIWQTCEGHFGSRDKLAWIEKELEEILLSPLEPSCLHGFAVWEQSLSCNSADHSSQGRGSSSLTISLSSHRSTSIPWQPAHWSSKMPFPITGSPGGTTTSGSLTSFFFFPAISKINYKCGSFFQLKSTANNFLRGSTTSHLPRSLKERLFCLYLWDWRLEAWRKQVVITSTAESEECWALIFKANLLFW